MVGIVSSTLSNALSGLIGINFLPKDEDDNNSTIITTLIQGASRVFQALARDNLLPGISFFAKGTRRRNEPRRAVLLTWVLAEV